MPYISREARTRLEGPSIENAGELNYLLTRLLLTFLGKDYNYERLNAAIGVLECCKLELYRRLGGPYEDRKIEQNGDIFPHNVVRRGVRNDSGSDTRQPGG